MIRITGIVNGTPADEIAGAEPAPTVDRPDTSLDLERLERFIREQAAPTFSFRGIRERSRYKHAALVLRALAGKPLSGLHEERNALWYRSFAGTIADMLARAEEFDRVDSEVLARGLVALFSPALEAQLAQDAQPGARRHTELNADRVEDMFARSLRDRRETVDRERAGTQK